MKEKIEQIKNDIIKTGNPEVNLNNFKEKVEVFHDNFPEGELNVINKEQIPDYVMKEFEHRSELYISHDEYRPENFDNYFLVNHVDGGKTYIAKQVKMYNNDQEENIYFVYEKEGQNIGIAELRNSLQCHLDSQEYFQNKPFIGWIKTDNVKVGKLSIRQRLETVNAFTKAFYDLPLYADTVITPKLVSIFEKLVKRGKLNKFKEGVHDRYVFKRNKK